jgi:transporter family-2 protein
VTPPTGAVTIATGLSVVTGVLLAGQAHVNGELEEKMGAAVPAALVSFVVGTAAIWAVVAVTRRLRPARARMRERRARDGRVPLWYLSGGLLGALVVASSAAAAPQVGVSILFVFLVLGQTVGALLVDAAGLGPGAARPPSPSRVLGTALAVGAAVIAAAGQPGGSGGHLVLLVVVVLAGAGIAVQQAANGNLQQVTGEATVVALVSFAVGTLGLAVLAAPLALAGSFGDLHWGVGPWWIYLGGLAGAVFITLAAAIVGLLGVLRLSLATISGQLLGALGFDALAPPAGTDALAWTTVAAVVLTFVAMVVAGLRRPA